MVAGPNSGRVRALITGRRVASDRVEAETAGRSLTELSQLFGSLTGSPVLLWNIGLTGSVEVELGSSEEELSRSKMLLRAAEREKDPKIREQLLQAAVPPMAQAGLAVGELLTTPEESIVETALAYGHAVTDAYKQLVRLLADEELNLTMDGPLPTGEPVVVDSSTAEQYKEALAHVGSERRSG